jgi:hypothetical protein
MRRIRTTVTALAVLALSAGCASAIPKGPPPPPSRTQAPQPATPLPASPTADPNTPLVRPLPNPTASGLGITLTELATLPRSQSLPADDKNDNYTYPVAAYGHNDPPPGYPKCKDSGYAVILGPVYRGRALPELDGKLIFGDGVTGRVFTTDVAAMQRGGALAPISELTLFDQTGRQINLEQVAGDENVDLAGWLKVDLRFGTDAAGELYPLSKADGKIWRVTAVRTGAPTPVQPPLHPL